MTTSATPAALLYLSLPLLHADGEDDSPDMPALLRERVAHLWPGLPHMPATGYWQPAVWPFSPEEAAQCLRDIAATSHDAASGTATGSLMASAASPEALRTAQEAQALARFAATGATAPADPMPALRRAAHIVLLHAWLMEEQQQELRTLARDFTANARRFGVSLGLEPDELLPQGADSLQQPLADEDTAPPPWGTVLENAALFLPEACVLCCNSAAMRTDVLERVTPRPASAVAQEPSPTGTLAADLVAQGLAPDTRLVCAPLWQVLGRSRQPDASPWLAAQKIILI